MLIDIASDFYASEVDLRWYVIGVLIAISICQDVFNAGYLYWNKPVSFLILSLASMLNGFQRNSNFRPVFVAWKWWSSLRFIIGAPQLIEKGYKQVGVEFLRGSSFILT